MNQKIDNSSFLYLWETLERLSSNLSLDEFLPGALRDILNFAGGERGAWILFSPSLPSSSAAGSKSWMVHTAVGFEPKAFEGDEMLFSRKAIEMVLLTGVGEAGIEPFSYLCIPLVARGSLSGALYMDHPSPSGLFTDEMLMMLKTLITPVAFAVRIQVLSDELTAVNESKAKFVSVVTHELRIPMTSIKGYTDLILHGAVGPVNEQQKNFLGVVRNNVERMSALVSDLSDISRIESGRLVLNNKYFRLTDCLDDALLMLQPKIEEKNQVLDISLAPDIPEVYADPVRVAQVLTNLVTNAHLYTPSDGKVSIRAILQADRVRVEVSDTGIGISSTDQEKLFSQFFRSENPDVREQPGWGLGLSVARKLVESMGGEIGVDSSLGKGSTFWFLLVTSQP